MYNTRFAALLLALIFVIGVFSACADVTDTALETTGPDVTADSDDTMVGTETAGPAETTVLSTEETTVPHEETTVPPVETTAPHEETTVPPVETTAPPAETTVPPVETTAPPVETTAPPAETTAPVEITPPAPADDYSAGPFKAEVYDPSVNNDPIYVYGASYSDSFSGVIFGKCAVGATVKVSLPKGDYTVQSEAGRFAVRIKPGAQKINAVITQWYDGKQIGEAVNWSGRVKVPNHGESNFTAIIGYSNQGFFEKMVPYFANTNLLDDAAADTISVRIKNRADQLKTLADGCEIIYLIAPSVITTYPEVVPESVAVKGEGKSKLDQTFELLRNAGVKVIDVRDTFKAHKNDALPLYYNFDSHWTEYGAYLAYVELFNYISEKFPAAAPRKFDEFNWTESYFTLGDMPYYFTVDGADLVSEYSVLRTMNFETSPVIKAIRRYTKSNSLAMRSCSDEMLNGKTYRTNRSELPNLYVIRNSYGMQMYDLIPERGNTTVMNPCFTYTYNLANITRNDPDYVIYIISEWDIDEILYN